MRVVDANEGLSHHRYIVVGPHEIVGLEEWAEANIPEMNRPFLKTVQNGIKGIGGGGKSFYLDRLKGLSTVSNRLERGWKGGAEKALELARGLEGKVSSPVDIRRRASWGENGDEYSRERLLDGHYDSPWRSTTRKVAIANPIIDIVCGWGGNCNRSHDELFWSGAAALALCNVLENSGYQTTLTAIAGHQYGWLEDGTIFRPHRQATICTLKGAGEYMRPDALASIICSTPVFRTYVFFSMAATKNLTSNSLGSMMEVQQVVPHAVKHGAIQPPQVVLPDCWSQQGAERALKNALRDLAAANLAMLPEEALR